MNRARRWLLTCMLCLAAGAAWAEAPLRLGLFPNLSPRALITMYQPLRLHLEQTLGRPVALQTAPDFHTFTQRLLHKEYDLAVAAPHLARLAQQDAGYRLVAKYRQPIQAYLIVRADAEAGFRRGSRVATPDDVAVVTMLGQEMLASTRLLPDRDYEFVEAKSHSNAALNVINGQFDAAVIGSLPYVQLPPELKAQLRIHAKSRTVPSQYFLAAPGPSPAQQAALAKALFGFAGTPAGQDFVERYGMGGIEAATQDELSGMDGFAAQTREILRKAGQL